LLLLEKFKWKDTAQIMIDAITHPKQSQQSPLRIGWISSWKTKCGIATYSEHLIRYCKQTNIEIFSPFSQEIIANDESIRCWSAKKENNDFATLKKVIDEKQCDLLVIQFNYGFFNFQELATFIEEQHTKGRVIVMMMHSTHDPFGSTANWQLSELQEILSKCHRILVHSLADLNRLKNMGLSHNVTIFPHGILPFDTRTKQNAYDSSAPTIASYGFCLPHKGLQELVEAIHILHQEGLHVKLKMVNAEYPVVESALLIEELKKSINNYGLEAYIELNNAFLEDEESLKELSLAQLVVFPYQRTGESASGAVRYGLATGCPVAVTPLTIFEDLGESVFKLSGISPNAIAQSLKEILVLLSTNDLKAKHILKEADRWREVHDYRHLAKRLENICYAITQKAKKI
ncbi:MAG: hypothetical protein PHE60_02505, partial [Sulfurospirillaceae bacterium]|nr:hypothetical protein [Sulfurospirillaceae bacterium]